MISYFLFSHYALKFKIGFLTRNNITPIPIQIKPRIPKNATSVSLLKDGVIKAFTACDVESDKNQRATFVIGKQAVQGELKQIDLLEKSTIHQTFELQTSLPTT